MELPFAISLWEDLRVVTADSQGFHDGRSWAVRYSSSALRVQDT